MASDGSEIMPASPLVACTRTNRNVGIVRMQRDGARHAERVVVGMGEDRGEPRAHPCPSRASNPTVRPGREATAFTAITTPGMNEVQSVES